MLCPQNSYAGDPCLELGPETHSLWWGLLCSGWAEGKAHKDQGIRAWQGEGRLGLTPKGLLHL